MKKIKKYWYFITSSIFFAIMALGLLRPDAEITTLYLWIAAIALCNWFASIGVAMKLDLEE